MLSNQFRFSPDAVTVTQVVANLGAMTGGTTVGYCSQIFGRRLSIIVMSVIGGDILYAYTFVHSHSVNAAEFFAPVFPEKPTRRFLRRLGRAQDIMGRMNDSAVAAKLSVELPGDRGFAAGAVQGWSHACSRAAKDELPGSWGRLKDAKPFWT